MSETFSPTSRNPFEHSEKTNQVVSLDHFPEAPASVRAAYFLYWNRTHIHDQQKRIDDESARMSRVNSILSDFCSEYIKNEVYHAAILMPLLDKTKDSVRLRNANRALNEYTRQAMFDYEGERQLDVNYTMSLVHDRPEIASFWQAKTQDIIQDIASDPEKDQAIATSLLPENYSIEPPIAAWFYEPAIVNIEQINALTDDVNMAALLIQAAELLERLESADDDKNSGKILSHLYASESLFIPLLKTTGFDGFAMALENAATKIRFENSGREKYLQIADNILANYSNQDGLLDSSVGAVLRSTVGDTIYEHAIQDRSKHGIIIGDGINEAEDRIVWRLKSRASLAKKIWRNHNAQTDLTAIVTPIDIIGATVITNDVDSMSAKFINTVKLAEQQNDITLQPSPSRDKAIHVSGTESFIDKIQQASGFDSRAAMEAVFDVRVKGKDEFQVAKITLVHTTDDHKSINTEIQFSTHQKRVADRIGITSHIGYKNPSDGQAANPDVLADLHGKKERLKSMHLTVPSKLRAQNDRHLLANLA